MTNFVFQNMSCNKCLVLFSLLNNSKSPERIFIEVLDLVFFGRA